MTISESLKFNTNNLKPYSATPRLDAEALLCFVLEKEKEFLFTNPKTKLNTTQSRRINIAIKKRIKGAPIAHIVGRKEFFGYDFFVNENVLVPRPETEMMVEEVLQLLKNDKYLTLVDIGTGSGCIPITIANEIDKSPLGRGTGVGSSSLEMQKTTHPALKGTPLKRGINFIAIDISHKALYVAKRNAETYNLSNKIKFFEGNLLEPAIPYLSGKNFLITANLPYLTPGQVENSPTIKQEPILALVAGSDGLKYYRELFDQIKAIETDLKYVILCEIDASQTENIKKLITEKLGAVSVEVKKDLAGLDRLVVIKN